MLTHHDIFYYLYIILYIYKYIAISENKSITWLVHDGVIINYLPVVMNYRGYGGALLKVFSNEIL